MMWRRLLIKLTRRFRVLSPLVFSSWRFIVLVKMRLVSLRGLLRNPRFVVIVVFRIYGLLRRRARTYRLITLVRSRILFIVMIFRSVRRIVVLLRLTRGCRSLVNMILRRVFILTRRVRMRLIITRVIVVVTLRLVLPLTWFVSLPPLVVLIVLEAMNLRLLF